MMAEVSSNDPLVNCNWKDRCIKLFEKFEEKNSAAEAGSGKNHNLEEKKELENKLNLIQEETNKLSKQLEEMRNDVVDKPINSSLLKLYGLISKLMFDIEASENAPKGYVAGNSLEIFQFDTAKHSQQFIIDSLWNLIEAQLKLNRDKKHTLSDWLVNSLDYEQTKRRKLS